MEREQRRLEKEEEIEKVGRAERALVNAHLHAFPLATAPKAPARKPVEVRALQEKFEAEAGIPEMAAKAGGGDSPPIADDPRPVDRAALRTLLRGEALSDISILRRGERRRARQQADEKAEEAAGEEERQRAAAHEAEQAELDRSWEALEEKRAEVAKLANVEVLRLKQERDAEQQKRQVELDVVWERLQKNDPPTVLGALEAAFADNEAPAAPINCEGDTVTVTMKFEGPEIVPERMGAYTPTGKPTLKKRPKGELNRLYLDSLASHVLATVKEALAEALGVSTVTVLVLREEVKGKQAGSLAAIYVGQFTRQAHPPENSWRELDPARTIESAPGAMLNMKGVAEEVSPLDLGEENELQEVLERVADDLGLPSVSAGATRPRRKKPQAGNPKKVLAGLSKERDPHKRWDALWSMRDGRLDLSLVEPLSELAANDDEQDVRRVALDLLVEIGDPKVAPALAKAAGDQHPYTREIAIRGLERVAPRDHKALFLDALDDSDPGVRQAAVNALEANGSDQAFSAITKAIEDPDPTVRFMSVAALRGRDDPAARAALKSAESDPDPDVREMAAVG
jgi:hypothetical protein